MLRRTKSLFGITDSLFPTEQGIVGNTSELLCKAAPERDETAGNFRIPCYFPCSEGIRGVLESPYAHGRRSAILAKRNTPFYANDISALQRGAGARL
jgi:hypothetical protein